MLMPMALRNIVMDQFEQIALESRYRSYILRIECPDPFCETTGSPSWRFQLSCLQVGKSTEFSDIERLLDFLRSEVQEIAQNQPPKSG